MNNLEILEFCFANQLLLEDIKQHHFQNNLKSLEDNRNFLQLNKISIKTLIQLLMEYYFQVSMNENNERSCSIINNIMETYFNRNNIRATDFFDENEVESLQTIWEQFHHTLQIYDNRKRPKAKSSDYFATSMMDTRRLSPSNFQNSPSNFQNSSTLNAFTAKKSSFNSDNAKK